MSTARAELGRRGEDAVVAWLRARGYAIVERNARVGRLEIDLVARRGDLLVFCEVRARKDGRFMAPVESIDARKAARVRRAVAGWLAAHSERRTGGLRIDAASVTFDGPGGSPRVEYYEDAFRTGA